MTPTPRRRPATLKEITTAAAAALLAGERPSDIHVAPDYPTEFSLGIAAMAGGGSPLGPWFVQAPGGIVVGDIGGGFVESGVAEIGYAIVPSYRRRGYATDAVRSLVHHACADSAIRRLRAHCPLSRPDSARVLEKAGFLPIGEVEDEHDGETLIVLRLERSVSWSPNPIVDRLVHARRAAVDS